LEWNNWDPQIGDDQTLNEEKEATAMGKGEDPQDVLGDECSCSGYEPGQDASLGTSFYASLTPVCDECGHSPEAHHFSLCLGSQPILLLQD